MVGTHVSEEFIKIYKRSRYAIPIASRYNVDLLSMYQLRIRYEYSSPGVEGPPLTINEIILLAEGKAKIWFDEIKDKADKSGIRFRSETIMVD
jgi:hypothetical protein